MFFQIKQQKVKRLLVEGVLLSVPLRGILLIMSAVFLSGAHADYSQHPLAIQLIDEMVAEEGFEREDLVSLFAQVEKKQSIIDAMSRPAEKTLTWAEYSKIFLTDSRVSKGVDFWLKNQETLERAEKEYGVPAQVVVAIIGVETRYGSNKGSYRVMDALSTLAFDYPKRSPFFTKELKHFLVLARQQQREYLELKGSYAGAMGYGQFMPSSYRSYAVDFDEDELVDIWDNPIDAIGSVANYFVGHGWQQGAPVTVRAHAGGDYDRSVLNDSLKPLHTVASLKEKGYTPVVDFPEHAAATLMCMEGDLGAEFWMGLNNFYTITRYNHSRLYAMAVYQLSEQIRNAYLAKTTPT